MTFVKSNRAGDFKLITDGWFNSTKSGDEYAARVYNDEEDKQEVVDLTSGGSKFIGRDVVYVDSKGVAHTTDNHVALFQSLAAHVHNGLIGEGVDLVVTHTVRETVVVIQGVVLDVPMATSTLSPLSAATSLIPSTRMRSLIWWAR